MTQTSKQDQCAIGKIGDKPQEQCFFITVNSEIFFIFARAKEHGVTKQFHNWSGCAKIGTPISQHRHHPHLPRHGRKPRHDVISQRWEDHHHTPEEWQDQQWWERE